MDDPLWRTVTGGAAVDAWPHKLTATVSQAALGVVAFTTAALVASGTLTMPLSWSWPR